MDRAKSVNPQLATYFGIRDQLTTAQGIILKGDQLIVPQVLQVEYTQQLHKGHLAVDACTRRTRDSLYWPTMVTDIATFIEHCATCNSHKPHQQKQPLMLHDIPNRAWQIVATDSFDWDGKSYLLVVDSYSGWFEIDQLHGTTSASVIHKMKHHFTRFGVPSELLSDNGPQYSSAEFHEFSSVWGFAHTTSSPEYPQSNGRAYCQTTDDKGQARWQ